MYTRADIPYMIAALRTARKAIENKHWVFICFALQHSTNFRGRHKAIRLVMDALYPYGTLDAWLHMEHGEELMYPDDVRRATRLAWIDKIIKDLEAYAAHV